MIVKESVFWNLIRIIWQKKRIFVISFFASMILTFIVTTLMSKTYKASLTFIVNEESSGFNITSLISDLPFDLGGMGSSNGDKYIALLKSRNIRDVLIEKYDLREEYNEEYIEFIYKELDQNIDITDNLDNTITISCYFNDKPENAFNMVNDLYNGLYRYSLELQKEKSKNYREYLEGSLKETYTTLEKLEDSMKVFQINNKIITFEEQAQFSFEVLGQLEAQNLLYKIEYDYLLSGASKSNPELKELNKKLDAIKKNKNKLYIEGDEYLIAFSKMPDLGLRYFRLFREIRIQQEILKILLPIVQNARIEEKKETVNIQIISEAFVPEYKVRPKRILYMLVVTVIIIFFEIFYFALLDIYKKNKIEINNWINNDDR